MKRNLIIMSMAAIMSINANAVNPYLPLWEYIPDGEPYVFEDPDNPGKYRAYIYGSHDIILDAYCGRDQVVWSAPVEDLNDWRYDGIILEVKHDRDGNILNQGGLGDVLYAPDVALWVDEDGTKTYYLYPNDQHGGRNGLVAKSSRPDGPFQVCNWGTVEPWVADGVLRFDPAVFVDDDGKVYGYWGFEQSFGAQFDPSNMANVMPGTEIVVDMVPGRNQDTTFRFFEASSIRKIKDKYVFIYSRWTNPGEEGLDESNYTLAYAWSNNPLGPWTYGGTLIDGRGREVIDGEVRYTAAPTGNTHGSIAEINGQWYVFYHRQNGTDEYSRQAMVEPIEVEVVEGPNGYVKIGQAELTSQGFEIDGLKLDGTYAAGIASHYTGKERATSEYPKKFFPHSHPKATRFDGDANKAPQGFVNPMTNNNDGSLIGYKYFNFDTAAADNMQIEFDIDATGIEATIEVIAGKPWEKGSKSLGKVSIPAGAKPGKFAGTINGLKSVKGKAPLYFKISSPTSDQSIGDINTFTFKK